ncbi:hypothetical protein MNBD_ALPHA02-1710 [hydrothermal vent metagenome]|uniref:Inner membrane protein YgaP-like transmembrane domain-containing protein n=1 Tax=hydrothermal vent metagenome TaxID=652676 RepID=A0A3B0RY03_9ZZZZ
MTIDRMVFAFAGIVIIVSIILALTVHIYWLGLAAFVGLNMLQASFTRFCPLAMILKKLGVKPGKAFS